MLRKALPVFRFVIFKSPYWIHIGILLAKPLTISKMVYIMQRGETPSKGEGSHFATSDVEALFFQFSARCRCVAPATFPPLTANFNAGEREGDKWRNVLRSRPTDRSSGSGQRGRRRLGEGKGESATMRLQNANTPSANEWWVGRRSHVWMDVWMGDWIDA